MRLKRLLVGVALAAFALSAVAQTAVVNSVNNLFNKAQTYSTTTKVTLASTPTWVAELKGSATKTVYVKSVDVQCKTPNAGYADITLSKLTAPSTSGTSATVSAVSHDSSNDTQTATFTTWTANPNNPGSGTSMVTKYSPLAPTSGATVNVGSAEHGNKSLFLGADPAQYIVLRGITQAVAIGLASQTLASGVCYFQFTWMEQ